MNIKVLVISDYRDYHTVRPEANVFVELAKAGVEVHIMTYKESAYVIEFEKVGIKVIDFHPKKKFDKSEIAYIRNYLIENKIDIIHLFNSKSIVNGIKASVNLPVKVVLYRGYAGNINWYDPSAYTKYLNRRVDKIVCNSVGVQQYINRIWNFDKSKTITINKGHDVNWYAGYAPRDMRKELELPADSLLLVNVANNRKMKGIPYLLKAMTMLPKELPIHLLLIGRDMDKGKNLKIVQQAGIENKVHFLGFQKDVLNIVAGCDVFVLSSIFGESITKSVIEAMSLGLAPIITDIPGNTELVEDELSGLVVPSKSPLALSEAILKLHNNNGLRLNLAEKAKSRIVNVLNTKNTVNRTLDLYRDLLG